MKQSFEYLKQVVALREKGNYHIEDMREDENYDPSKIYWSCFAETPEEHECILIYAFDKEEFKDKCPDESCFDNPKYAVAAISCSNWK